MPVKLVMPATQDQALRIVPLLAEAERARLLTSPSWVLRLSEMSWAGLRDDVPLCVGGVVGRGGGQGFIWMVATPELPRHRRALLRGARDVMAEAARNFSVLTCGVETAYPRSIRLLEWLGFRRTAGPAWTQIGRRVEIVLMEWEHQHAEIVRAA